MRLLVGLAAGDTLLIRVPLFNQMKTEIDRLYAVYGGVFAMNVSHFILTHECVPLFESPASLLELSKTARILILIPGISDDVHRMYETWRKAEPLFMFDRGLHISFVKAALVLEYKQS